jgi:hypothetical protein
MNSFKSLREKEMRNLNFSTITIIVHVTNIQSQKAGGIASKYNKNQRSNCIYILDSIFYTERIPCY